MLTGQVSLVTPVRQGASHARAGSCHQFGNGRAGNTGLAACVTSTGEGWDDEQAWLLLGTEQLWGGCGCQGWPKSTMMGAAGDLGRQGCGARCPPCPTIIPGAGPGIVPPLPTARGCSP